MFKNIKSERIICMLLVVVAVLSFITYFNVGIVEAGRTDALADGADLYGAGTACSCAPTYAVIDRSSNSGMSGGIEGTIVNYTSSNASGVSHNGGMACKYSASGHSDIYVPCNKAGGEAYLKKYIDAGIFGNDANTTNRANKFYNDAYAYASYVQQGLSSKTQVGNGIGNSGWSDLGNGQFQRAMFEFNNNAHYVYSFLIGFAFVTAMLVFILIFMKITWLPDHPIKRREAMEDIVTSGVSVILTGGIWVVISLFQSIFDRFWSSYAVYSKDWKSVANMFLYEYKGLVIGVLGVAALTALLMLIKNFVGLSFSGDNPSARKQKIISILFCGIATAGLGGLAIVMGFFWNMLG